MAAIAMCIAVMFCATALISGFKNEISDKIFGFWGHVHITDASINRSLHEPQPIKANVAFLDSLRNIEQIEYQEPLNILGYEFEDYWVSKESDGGIKHIQSFGIKPGIIKTKTDLEGVILKGVSTDYNWGFIGNYLVEGEAIAFNDSIASRDIIISQQTANRLNSKVDDKILVHFVQDDKERKKAFKIKGIYKTGLEEYDKKFALVDLKIIQELLGWAEDEVAGYEVLLDDIDDLDVMKDYIYLEELPQNYYAQSIKDKFPVNFQWLEMQSTNEQVIVGLMLLVGIINMITALLILILERTTMIGILKALGSTDWVLQKMFLYYAGYIVLGGLFWGNLIGFALCTLQDKFRFIKLSEADYYLSYAPVDIQFGTIMMLNIGVFVLTIIFLVIPSYLVGRINPVKAIRFK